MVCRPVNAFSSGGYWNARYATGGNAGAGSRGRLARFKADVINGLVAERQIASVLDLGCGDGSLLPFLTLPGYTGVDVSPVALARCAERCPHYRFAAADVLESIAPAELALSIDVVFHLVEDPVFEQYMATLFGHATRFVLIYSSNFDMGWPMSHVRHRRFTDHVAATQSAWQLLAHEANRYPFDPAQPDDTSFADFFLFGRR
jgi:trans-aconitate methyltransferase